jgi:radical SAM protein with 4Fe4S-binding SPASM domain
MDYRDRFNDELKTKDIFNILEQLKKAGCFYLGFTGGEPFVRKDAIKIFSYAKKLGFELMIYTNGSLINKTIAKELGKLSPNKVDITIPAMSEGAFDKIVGVSGFRDKVFQAIELLHKNKVNLGFKSCILRENKSEIDRISKFAKSLGAQYRLDDKLTLRLNGSTEPLRYRAISIKSLKRSRRKNSDSLFQCGSAEIIRDHILSSQELFECGSGTSQVAINPSGELKICLEIDYPKYSIIKTSFHDVWNKLNKLVSAIKPDENYLCSSCGLSKYCDWCPGKSWLEHKNFTSCSLESRDWAEHEYSKNRELA